MPTITRPRCLEELAGRLYAASDGAELAAQHLAASGATDRRVAMQEPGLYLHNVARELETLGDYVYALTRSGAELSSG